MTGVDILEPALQQARATARTAGLAERCTFARDPDRGVDVVVSVDGFEHFGDPGTALRTMHRLLRPGGRVLVAFGPTWLHPLGGHLFSVFPWAHLVFTEAALIRWRSHFKRDGARHFGEVEGGLNQMTIHRFRAAGRGEPAPVRDIRDGADPAPAIAGQSPHP